MHSMRAALRIRLLACALLASAAVSDGAVVLPAGSGPADSPGPTAPGLPPAAVAAQLIPPQNVLLASPTTRDHVGRVEAAVMVDGKGPFRFIIDTGANQSTMSPRLAAFLGLASAAGQMRIAGVTGTAIVPSVAVDSLRAGALVIMNTHLPVIGSPILAGSDGILGAAGLSQDTLLVDFRHDTVEIRRAGSGILPAGYVPLRATRLKGGLLSVPGEVGPVPVTAIIDTGSPQTLGNAALFRALYSRAGKSAATSVYGATMQVRSGRLRLAPTIDLGAIHIDNPVLVYGDFPIFQLWGLTGHPAVILGMDILGTVDGFSIDFRHARIGVAAPVPAIPLSG